MKVKVAVLGSLSLIVLMVSVHVIRAQKLCESQDGRPGPPIPNRLYDLSGCKATLNMTEKSELGSCVKVKMAVLGPPSLTLLMVSAAVKQH